MQRVYPCLFIYYLSSKATTKAVPGPLRPDPKPRTGRPSCISPFYSLLSSSAVCTLPLDYPALPPPFLMATKAAYKRVHSPIPAFASII